MKTVKPKTQKAQARKRTAKQIRFRQHANKIKKAWALKPERIIQTIEKILDGYAGKLMEQQLVLVNIQLMFAVFRKPIENEDPVKYNLIHSWVHKRKAEIVSEIFFYAFKFQWENKYWVTPASQLKATKNARNTIERNLTEGTPGDNFKSTKVNIFQLLQNGIFPGKGKFSSVDIAEVISGMKSLEYFDNEIAKLENSNPKGESSPSNLIIQVNQNDEEDDVNGLQEEISINIPINKITDAIKTSFSSEPDTPISESKEPLPLTYYNRVKAAEVLGVTPPTLDSYVRKGDLNYRTMGKEGRKIYLHEDLDAYMVARNKKIRR